MGTAGKVHRVVLYTTAALVIGAEVMGGYVVAFGAPGTGAATPGATQPVADAAEIDRLIKQLGSEVFAEREAGQHALTTIGLPAAAALRQVSADGDPERAERAKTAYQQIEEAAWGQAGNGLQVRLRPLWSQWALGQMPELSLDVRNVGEHKIPYIGIAPAECQVRVDGRWYGWSKPVANSGPGEAIWPGKMATEPLRVALSEIWAQPSNGERPPWAPGVDKLWSDHLKLGVGLHTVQVLFAPGAPNPSVEAMSNPVEVMVVAPPATQAAIGADVPANAPEWVKTTVASMPRWELDRFDIAPSIEVGERNGYRLLLRQSQKIYPTLPLGGLSEDELRTRPFVMRYRHLELVVVPGGELPEEAAKKISWSQWENDPRYFKKVIYLGQGIGMHWYGHLTLFDQEQLRQVLELRGGGDRLALLTEALLIDDEGTWTRNSCVYLLAAAGDKALPYIKSAVEKAKDGWKAIYALAFIQTDAATEYLKELYQQNDTRSSAQLALIYQPFRIAAKEQYFDMLRQRTRVFEPAQACVQFGWKEAVPLLNDIYIQAHSLGELQVAFQARRTLEGNPVPEDLRQAEQQIELFSAFPPAAEQKVLNHFKATMLASKDTEAAAVISIRLALIASRRRGPGQSVQQAAREVLRQLPRKPTQEIVDRLAQSLPTDPSYAQRVKDLRSIFSEDKDGRK